MWNTIVAHVLFVTVRYIEYSVDQLIQTTKGMSIRNSNKGQISVKKN